MPGRAPVFDRPARLLRERRHMQTSLLQNILISAEKALAAEKGYDGWMIGRCRLSVPAKLSVVPVFHISVLKQRKTFAVLQAGSENGAFLEMTMLLPSGTPAKEAPCAALPSPGKDSVQFSLSSSEMEEFLKAVGDDNPLHSGENAILPGFLIFNRLLSDFSLPSGEGEVISSECRFLSPLHPGEPVVFLPEPAAKALSETLFSGKLCSLSDGREILTISFPSK